MIPSRAHVAVDVRLATSAGHLTYARGLIPRLARLTPEWRWTLIGDRSFLERADWAHSDNISIEHCGARVYGLREQWEVPRAIPRDADLFWATHYNVPLFPRRRFVVTIHDVAHLRLPEYTSKPLRQLYASTLFRSAVGRASAIIVDSDFTRRELAELFGKRDTPTSVVHLGVDDAWFANGETQAPQTPYFVFVGNLKPHKNVATLLAAFERLAGVIPERLVIAGNSSTLRTADKAVLDRIATLGDRLSLAGALNDEDLRAVVRGATALVMPSVYEGFGLPPLEAMAAGCPTIVSRAASLPEICGEAPVYFDAMNEGQLADAMRSLSSNQVERRSLSARGVLQARKFDWSRSAAQTLDVLRSALTAGR